MNSLPKGTISIIKHTTSKKPKAHISQVNEGKMVNKEVALNAILCLGRFLETNEQESCLADEFQGLFNIVFLINEWHNTQIVLRTLNLRITSTRDYPVEPLRLLNLQEPHIHMVKMYFISAQHQENSKHTRELRAFLEEYRSENVYGIHLMIVVWQLYNNKMVI